MDVELRILYHDANIFPAEHRGYRGTLIEVNMTILYNLSALNVYK